MPTYADYAGLVISTIDGWVEVTADSRGGICSFGSARLETNRVEKNALRVIAIKAKLLCIPRGLRP